ncbi:MAG: AAA family ATPase [Ruegeria sp.]|nr:AAA family ATPase [Ruegeria sp.]
MEKHLEAFEEQAIDLDIVRELTEADLSELGIPLGDRKRLIGAARALEAPAGAEFAFREETPGFPAQAMPPERSIGELRQMTIMFADLVNSTGLVQDLGVEAYRDTLKAFQSCNSLAIQENFGHVAQFIGDGVVAYFGYPIANEDDVERAALTALRIVEQVARIDTGAGQTISVRIGIATGDVLIEDLMHRARPVDSIALGQIPNLAARLQSIADPGQIVISGRTRGLLGRNFQCTHMGAHQLKGFVEPVEAWRVEGSESTELRFDKRRRGTLAPLVGRDQEFDLLRARWQAACQGDGQAVFLSGEAGLGKSRLAEEIYRELVQGKAHRLSFQCSPYHENSAFHPIKSHFGYAIGLEDSDTAEVQNEKLHKFFTAQGLSPEVFSPVFSSFLSAGKQAGPVDDSPEEAKSRVTESLLSYIEEMSRQQPLLILFEDLHWIDPSSEAFLSLLIDWLDDMQVMVLGTYRPEFSPRWYGDSKTTILSLARLSTQDTRHLLAALSASDKLLENIETAVVSHSEGVPLFVEEMVSMLEGATNGSLKDQALFPSSLKDLLRARLDHLNVTPDTVSICAALDRNFSAELVAAMADRPVQDIGDELTRLVKAQILVTKPHSSKGRFSFRHALIRDAAYDAILPQKARHLHHRIADTMRRRFSRYCDRNPEILALHYRKAEQQAAARDLWHQAATLSLRNYAGHEAVAHLTAALEAHDDLDRDDMSDAREIELRQDLFVALEMRGWGSPDIGVNLERLIELKEKTGDQEVAFISLNHAVGENLIAGRPNAALEDCARMAALIQTDPSPTFHTLCHHYRGMALLLLGEFDRAIKDFDLALEFQRNADPDELHRYYPADTAVIDRVMRCWAGALKHMSHDVIADELTAAIALARDAKSEFTRCFALCIIATIYCVVDEPEQSQVFADETYRISDKIELRYWEAWSSVLLGWAEAKRGSPEKGIERLRAGLDRYIASGSGMLVAFSHTLLADACLCMDEVEEAANQIAKARKRLEGSAIGFHRTLTHKIAEEVDRRGRAGHIAQ